MPAEPPIACSLSATELPVRQAQMAELGRDALVEAHVGGTHAELRLTIDASEDAEPVLAELVDAFRGLAADTGLVLHGRRLGRNGC